jgi:D-ribose pyranose/furanose isomerase RbsD
MRAEDSVHLQDWPATATVDETSLTTMQSMRDLVSEALVQRASLAIPIRQTLGTLVVPQRTAAMENLFEILREELNVEQIVLGETLQLDATITPELKEKGFVREFVRHINAVRKSRGLKPGDHIVFTLSCGPFAEFIERNRAWTAL